LEFNHIERRKPYYPISDDLREHLGKYSRLNEIDISYEDLKDFSELIPIMDKNDEPTLWYSALYPQSTLDYLLKEIPKVYEILMSEGVSIPHLRCESIDYCSFGNSKPFRIKIVNEINDNHDYMYIKEADASRIYGLELEEIFSPNKVHFFVCGNTLVEEHIVGIPFDDFFLRNRNRKIENRLRLAKEFVKFNERCFARLLGDMRAYNFVVQITQDFDNVQYRLRAIDFDQQNYEGRKNIYLPQYYKDNMPLVELGQELLSYETAHQYRLEERAAMNKRYQSHRNRTRSLIKCMSGFPISSPEKIKSLAEDLGRFHKDDRFASFTSMGQILEHHLENLLDIRIQTGV
jgi:hypothetical protein